MRNKEKERTNSNNIQKKGRYNPWKWAFVLLLLFNLFIGFYVLAPSSLPVENLDSRENVLQTEEHTTPYTFTVQLSQGEVTRIANDYLESISNGEPNLSVAISDTLVISGNVDILGLTVPYQMAFIPRTLINGNLKLEVIDFEISNLSLPVSIIMNIINRELDFPEWIVFDTEEESILLFFNQLVIEDRVQILVEKMDLRNDDIQLKIHLKSEDLFSPSQMVE